MRLQTWRGSGEVNGGQQRSTEVNTNEQQEATQGNRSQQKYETAEIQNERRAPRPLVCC